MPWPLLFLSWSDYLMYIVDTNSHTKWQTVQIQISWLLQKPTDLDLHCLQRQGISGFSRTRANISIDVFISMGWISYIKVSWKSLQNQTKNTCLWEIFHIYHKYSDKHVWAKCVRPLRSDPDQTDLLDTIWPVCNFCFYSASIFRH